MSHVVDCPRYPVAVVNGTDLYINGGHSPARRFFAAGMVYSSPAMLSTFDATAFTRVAEASRRQGASTLRWNAFLKGMDLTFSPQGGVITGLLPGCLEALRLGLDIAQQHGLLVQVVLATAHFCRCGWGGCDKVLHGVRNGDRVARNHQMLSTEDGIAGYVEHVLDPILRTIGRHPALFGFLVLNEGYGMVRAEDNLFTYLTDMTLSLVQLQRFVNRIAGHIRRTVGSSAIVSASIKVKTCEQEESGGGSCAGKTPPLRWYDDAALVAAGGDPAGTMSMHQIQFYPSKVRSSQGVTPPFTGRTRSSAAHGSSTYLHVHSCTSIFHRGSWHGVPAHTPCTRIDLTRNDCP